MSSLENSLKTCIEKELEKGIIEKVIAEQLEKSIEKSISDMFGWSGEIKKVLEAKIKSGMIPYLEAYDYSKYITKLDTVLVDVLNSCSLENKTILGNFKELIGDPIKEVKMSEILTKWAEHCEKNIDKDKIQMDCEGGYFTATISSEKVNPDWSDFSRYIVLLECEEDSDLKYEFEISKWDKYETKFSLRDVKAKEISSLRNLSDFEMFLLKVGQAGNIIELDVEDDSEDVHVEYEYN